MSILILPGTFTEEERATVRIPLTPEEREMLDAVEWDEWVSDGKHLVKFKRAPDGRIFILAVSKRYSVGVSYHHEVRP